MKLFNLSFGKNQLKKENILNAFPKALYPDVVKVIEIIPSTHNILIPETHELFPVMGPLYKIESLFFGTIDCISLDNQNLTIPYRVYFREPDLKEENKLTDLQKTILNCIYLRHHDGFVRQRRLELLVDRSDDFIFPFTFYLIGEYIIQIINVLDGHINQTNIDSYVKFVNKNPKLWFQTKSRVVSYWNEFYRHRPYPEYPLPTYTTVKEFIGQQLVDRLQNRIHRSQN